MAARWGMARSDPRRRAPAHTEVLPCCAGTKHASALLTPDTWVRALAIPEANNVERSQHIQRTSAEARNIIVNDLTHAWVTWQLSAVETNCRSPTRDTSTERYARLHATLARARQRLPSLAAHEP